MRSGQENVVMQSEESGQATEWTVWRVEAEGQYRRIILITDVHASSTCECLQLAHIPNSHRHVALSTADRKVKVIAVLARLPGEVELDSCERELEGDASVLDGALSLDGQRRRRHRHAQVHCSEAVVRRRRACRTSATRRHCRPLAKWPRPKLALSGEHTMRWWNHLSLQQIKIIILSTASTVINVITSSERANALAPAAHQSQYRN